MKQIERVRNPDAIVRADHDVGTLRSRCFMKGVTMATIDKRISSTGKMSYRVRTRLKGFPPQIATFARKTDAEKWAAATESAQREGRYFTTSEAKRHTLSELVERYQREILPLKPKNARNQRVQLEWWKAQLGCFRLVDVTPANVAECRDRLRGAPMPNGKPRSAATVVRYLAVLSHAFTVAMKEWGWVGDNPLRKVARPTEARGRARFLDDNERARLLAACQASSSPLLYPIVVLAMSTGMRKGEILGLSWQQVDFAREFVTLHQTKNGERRGVPLAGHALSLLRKLHEARDGRTDLVFPSPTVPKPILIAKAWTTALAAAGIKQFRFHDLRHSAASYLVMNGATLPEIGDLLGHKSVQMTKRYAHLAQGHTRRIVAEMNEQIFKRAEGC